MRRGVLVVAAAVPCLVPLAFGAESETAGDATVKMVSSPPSRGANAFYTGNRAPLLANPLIKLPLGSVRPNGWLRRQLELEAEGFTGRLTEISSFCRREGNAWVDPKGEGHSGWEEVPYWLRGYWDLGFILKDQRIMAEAKHWVEGVLSSQWPDGYFGSRSNLEGERFPAGAKVPDLWPNMVMLFPLRSLYEATGDRRVLPFMSRYYRWQTRIPLEKYIPASWQHWRAGDDLDSMYWLYNRTGEAWLLDLARVNHERMADWIGGIPTWHVVNIAECFRAPAQYYQQTRDVRYLRASERVYDTIRGIYGQVAGGMYGADENARPGFTGPRQGTETCAFAEMMYSDELLVGITGDRTWADRAEEIAFNSLPASMSPDLKGLHYLTAPNQIQLDRADKSPMVQNGGDMFSYNPHQFRCCQHNVSFAWPYLAEHLWMATRDNGVAAVFYAASEVDAKVGGGTAVNIKETTDYPFSETIHLAVTPAAPVRFPLTLRVPGWSGQPKLKLNGKPLAVPKTAGGWLVVDRIWTKGDRLEVEFPARITTTVWTKNRDTVSIHRGPLTYSLKIGERWEKKLGTEAWPGSEVYPTTPWNYGLVLDEKNPGSSFEIVKATKTVAPQPFTVEAAPILLRAKGRRIPEWKQETNGMVGEVQPGPVASDQPIEEITLVPMGCARLRISAFPRIGEGPEARRWGDPPPIVLASAALHFNPPTVVLDGQVSSAANRQNVQPFTWFERRGSREWVEYQFSAPKRIASSEVYWAGSGDESDRRAAVRLPESWWIEYWDGSRWQRPPGVSSYPVNAGGVSHVSFTPVTSSRFRLVAQLRENSGGGLFEWRVGE